METFIKYASVFTAILAIVLFSSVVHGTLVWWLWPNVVPVIAPRLVELGYVPGDIGWFTAFSLCWLVNILLSKVIYNEKG